MPKVKKVSRRTPPMTAERVVDQAVAIVDADGVGALTIRALAAACDVSPMAIYRHVHDKDELLDRVVDRVTSKWADELPDAVDDWRADLRHLFTSARALLLTHPGVTQLCVARPTPVPGVARIFDRMIGALERGGFQSDETVKAFDAFLMFLFGSVLWELPRGEHAREQLITVSARAENLPHVIERRAALAHRDAAAYFEFGLEALLRGLEASR